MKTKKLSTLLRMYDFKQNSEYFDLLINSYYNGQFIQAKEQFKAMTKKDRKNFLEYIKGCYDNFYSKGVFIYYFDLILES